MTTTTPEAIADRVLGGVVEAMDVLAIALGDRLGFYVRLAEADERGMSADELAGAAGTTRRYTREWLEQQAVTGILVVDGVSAGPDADGGPEVRRFRLAPGVDQVLADPDSLLFLAPLTRQLAAAGRRLPAIADAARTGIGVPWADFGPDMRESEADLNRPAYLRCLAHDWLSALPDVQERLRRDPAARIADVGCGAGWSAIAMAAGYPGVRVDGFDLDRESVTLARRNVAEAGLSDRVTIYLHDIAETHSGAGMTGPNAGGYALVTAFECLHDLPRPVEALSAMRRLAIPDGAVLVADMRVADSFTAPGDDVERLMYGFSLLVCLPDSMSAPGSVATGTVMRAATLNTYAEAAGFAGVEVLPIEHAVWRFYRLHSQGREERREQHEGMAQ